MTCIVEEHKGPMTVFVVLGKLLLNCTNELFHILERGVAHVLDGGLSCTKLSDGFFKVLGVLVTFFKISKALISCLLSLLGVV